MSEPARYAPHVLSVSHSGEHRFSKPPVASITVLAGLGVAGDAHMGAQVQHLSRVRADPAQPNLRQVHLLQAELFDELRDKGFSISPGDLGENVTTRGIDVLDLPRGTILHIGDEVSLEVTGLRNPCAQIEAFRPGLLAAVLDRGPDGELVRKAGIMTVVRTGGTIARHDPVAVELPPEPHHRLERV